MNIAMFDAVNSFHRTYTPYVGFVDVAADASADAAAAQARFTQLAAEAAMSRVYGGIHFDVDTQAGLAACLPAADYVYANMFRLSSAR